MARLTGKAALVTVGASGLGAQSATRWSLMVILFGAFAIMAPALLAYDRQPTALFTQRIRGARGITRITRHPFFVGVTMLAAAHTLLATYLVGSVFFGALALLALGSILRGSRWGVLP